MTKYLITTLDLDGQQVEYRIEADDEAAALNHLLGEHGDELPAKGEWFLIRPAPKRKQRKGKRRKSGDPAEDAIQAMADRLGLVLEQPR